MGIHKYREMSEAENNDLPVPRLEIRWKLCVGDVAIAEYSLITRHLCGQIEVRPFGRTRCSGSNVRNSYCKALALPFRDGAHIVHDKEQLRVPGYVIYKKNHRLIEATSPQDRE